MWTFIRCMPAVLALLLPATAWAQPLPDWTSCVQIGKPLFVTTTSGDRVDGIAGQVADDGVVVATPVGVRTVRYADIGKVEKRDSVWSGVAIGAAVGLGIGTIWRANIDCATPACSNEANVVISGGAFYGAVIGWGIDAALKGRQTLYRRTPALAPISFSVRPRGFAARAVIAW